MAVVYVPQDTRWGQLGQGIGDLASSIIQARQQNNAVQIATQVMADPSVPPEAKLQQIAQQGGTQAVLAGVQLLKAQQLQGQITQQGAETERTRAATQYLLGPQTQATAAETSVRQNQAAATALGLPYVAPQAAADVARTQAVTGLTGAEVATRQAQLPYVGEQAKENVRATQAEIGRTQAATAGAQAAYPAIAPTAQAEAAEAQARAALATRRLQYFQQGGLSIVVPPDQLKALGLTDPAQQNKAQVIYQQTLGATGDPSKAIADVQKYAQELKEPTSLPAQIGESNALLGASRSFVEAMLKSPQSFGVGAHFLGWLQTSNLPGTKALGTDPQLQNAIEAQAQSVQHLATEGGGGFGGEWKAALARTVTSDVNRNALTNIQAMSAVADAHVNNLEGQRSQLPAERNVVSGLDEQIRKWREFRDAVHVDLPVVHGPDGVAKSIVMVGGNQVDPNTLQPVVWMDQVYKAGGRQLTGAEIIDFAKAFRYQGISYPLDPQEYLRLWQAGQIK